MLVLARLTVIRRDAGAETIGGIPIPPVVALHISARDVHPTYSKVQGYKIILNSLLCEKEGSLPPTLVGRRKMTMKNKHIAAINPRNLSREELISIHTKVKQRDCQPLQNQTYT